MHIALHSAIGVMRKNAVDQKRPDANELSGHPIAIRTACCAVCAMRRGAKRGSFILGVRLWLDEDSRRENAERDHDSCRKKPFHSAFHGSSPFLRLGLRLLAKNSTCPDSSSRYCQPAPRQRG